MQTEFEFQLPRGFMDSHGRCHTHGRMRLATAKDEVETWQQIEAHHHTAYLPLILLARVILEIGDISPVTPQVLEGLFASDLAYLQDLYLRLNGAELVIVGAVCPYCTGQFQVQVAPLG